jgi:hypothetical protein
MITEKQALLIHYPSGGFGHFMNVLLSVCSRSFYVANRAVEFSPSGDSHAFELSAKKWTHDQTDYVFSPADWATGQDLRHIVLVDLGINNDCHRTVRKQFPKNQLVRMCIDPAARSIINQTCLFKAQKQTEFNFVHQHAWQQREEISKQYHYCDANSEYYLNKFQPIADDCYTLNLPISWLFFSFELLLTNLETFLGIIVNRTSATVLHQQFLKNNQCYAQANIWAQTVLDSLESEQHVSLADCTNIHDQGFVNYTIEKQFSLEEIPPYDYQDWFTNTQQIAQAINRLTA